MIVGDVITTQTAKAIGLQTILITTSPESVDTTLDNSISLHKELLSLEKERILPGTCLRRSRRNCRIQPECRTCLL